MRAGGVAFVVAPDKQSTAAGGVFDSRKDHNSGRVRKSSSFCMFCCGNELDKDYDVLERLAKNTDFISVTVAANGQGRSLRVHWP